MPDSIDEKNYGSSPAEKRALNLENIARGLEGLPNRKKY